MKAALQNTVVSIFGLIASMLTALLLWQLDNLSGFAIYTFSLWFVVPAGAIACGFVAAAGYYVGAVLCGHRPTKTLLLNMVIISISTFFTIYWLAYSSQSVKGRPLSELVPFSHYLQLVLENQAMEFRFHGVKVGDTGALGHFEVM